MANKRAPFPYIGGKFYLLDRLISLIGGAEAELYVEPCVGVGWKSQEVSVFLSSIVFEEANGRAVEKIW